MFLCSDLWHWKEVGRKRSQGGREKAVVSWDAEKNAAEVSQMVVDSSWGTGVRGNNAVD
jgi:hypothetical protein